MSQVPISAAAANTGAQQHSGQEHANKDETETCRKMSSLFPNPSYSFWLCAFEKRLRSEKAVRYAAINNKSTAFEQETLHLSAV